MPKTWFITGASRGFGREWSIAALERGDTVAATARDAKSLDDLVQQFGDEVLPLRLDADDRDAVLAAVQQAHEHFGALDVVVNNAGYGQFGMVEEISEAEARAQFDTTCSACWAKASNRAGPALGSNEQGRRMDAAAGPAFGRDRSASGHVPIGAELPTGSYGPWPTQALLRTRPAARPVVTVGPTRRAPTWPPPAPSSS